MARKNPHLQTRSEYGHYWGVYADETLLPNVGTIAPANLIEPLEQGDIAYVSGGNAPGLYQCDDPGVTFPVPDGLAQWSQIGGGGGGGQDRFAPTYLVGNTMAGDSAVPYIGVNGFSYYPDIGDGAQLEQALQDAASSGGRVYIRRGTYDLGLPGSPVTPMVVSSGVAVQGEGYATIIQAGLVNQGVFNITGNLAGIEQLQINAAASATSAGSDAVVRVGSVNATLSDLRIDVGGDPQAAGPNPLRRAIHLDGAADAHIANIRIRMLTSLGVLDPMIGISATNTSDFVGRDIRIDDGDQAISMDSSSASIQQLVAIGWNVNAIILSTGGQISLITARLASALAAVAAEGIVLAGSGHTLTDVNIANGSALPGTTGIRFTSKGNVQISGCRITDGWFFGITLGTPGATAMVNTTITNCVIEATSIGVDAPEDTTGLVVAKNQISISAGGTGPLVDAGVRIGSGVSANNTIEGNAITVSGAVAPYYGIDNAGQTSTFKGNEISAQTGIRTGIGATSTGERCVVEGNTISASVCIEVVDDTLYNIVNGNVCFTADNPYTGPIIIYGGEYGVVSNNVTIVTNDVSSPGIRLTAASDNSNAIGNVCRGTLAPASIVEDLGAGNSVAQNLGAL